MQDIFIEWVDKNGVTLAEKEDTLPSSGSTEIILGTTVKLENEEPSRALSKTGEFTVELPEIIVADKIRLSLKSNPATILMPLPAHAKKKPVTGIVNRIKGAANLICTGRVP